MNFIRQLEKLLKDRNRNGIAFEMTQIELVTVLPGSDGRGPATGPRPA